MKKGSVDIFPNYDRRFFRKESLLRPGHLFPLISPWIMDWSNSYVLLGIVAYKRCSSVFILRSTSSFVTLSIHPWDPKHTAVHAHLKWESYYWKKLNLKSAWTGVEKQINANDNLIQQDGATPHSFIPVRQRLNLKFPGGLKYEVLWLSGSPDLSPLDFFLRRQFIHFSLYCKNIDI